MRGAVHGSGGGATYFVWGRGWEGLGLGLSVHLPHVDGGGRRCQQIVWRFLPSQGCNTPESTLPPCSLLLASGLRREIQHYLHTPLTHIAAGLRCFNTYIPEVTCFGIYSSGRIAGLMRPRAWPEEKIRGNEGLWKYYFWDGAGAWVCQQASQRRVHWEAPLDPPPILRAVMLSYN